MVGEIATAMTSLKAAFDIAKGISEIAKSADIQSAVIGLQKQILDAQNAALTARDHEAELRQQITRLHTQIAAFEQWQAEKQRYQLEILHPGVAIYGLRPEARNGEPDHKICAVCFNAGKKTILNCRPSSGQTIWECRVCGSAEYTGTREAPRVHRHAPSGW